ncbi:hypothetical protein GUITHDRAFT_132590 [Guillardia theta CCMP2712]|uniref:Thioredoxin domain-containing protein n=1 Tax=Guillardia theta (strain CCMP2712) TaxID=905079 RepID=L1K0R1_GUITC|nr:hypothetical protein GUITHDRAFT_132590 [Guillardia theta CCMP2712]EKX54197.1 hypothetical protein GUITHDRAFT_132590 [Guillardia theta CCMP2712]|eukprot:XP_005841177.1 hypothetical protein GUITHDRAFT_132590 [Guillardia theta CCMP2712]
MRHGSWAVCLAMAAQMWLTRMERVGADAGIGVSAIKTAKDLDELERATDSLLVAFLSSQCERSRQLIPNLKWAANQLAQEGLTQLHLSMVILEEMSPEDRRSLEDKYGATDLPAVKWVHKGEILSYDGQTSANGIHKWVRDTIASFEFPDRMRHCDACRRSLEAMHHDWGPLVSRLAAAGIISPGGTASLSSENAESSNAMMKICSSSYMNALSNISRADCARVWHGHKIVSRHFSLFASWCKRSSDQSRDLSIKEIQDCANQWSSKVPNGRLGLHEKIMGFCSDEPGSVMKVCGFERTGWQAKKRLARSEQYHPTVCEACEGIVDDMAFVLRTSSLGQAPAAALRKRSLDLSELLEPLCTDSYNRHEGDATEGPARDFHEECAFLFDNYEDEVSPAPPPAAPP